MIPKNDKIKVYNRLLMRIGKLNKAQINSYAVFFCLKSFYRCGNIKNYTKFIDEIARITGLTTRTTRTKLKELEQLGLIKIAKGSIYLTSFKRVADKLEVNRIGKPIYISFTELKARKSELNRVSCFVKACKYSIIQNSIKNQNAYVKIKRIQEIVYAEHLKSLNAHTRKVEGTKKQSNFKSISVQQLHEKLNTTTRRPPTMTAKYYWYNELTKEQRQQFKSCPANNLIGEIAERITTKQLARTRTTTNAMELRNANLSVNGFNRLLKGSGQYWKSEMIASGLIHSKACIVAITNQIQTFPDPNKLTGLYWFKTEYLSKCKRLVFLPNQPPQEMRKNSVWFRRVLPCYISLIDNNF